jgi:hypothetical protein
MSPEDVRKLREMAGNKPFDIAVGGHARPDDNEPDAVEAERAHIRAVADAGATWWKEWIPPGDRETMRAAVDRGPLRS